MPTGRKGFAVERHTVDIADAPGNVLGGTGPHDGNVISGSRVGVHIRGDDATENLVQGNRIGTNAAGTEKIASNRGIEIKTLAANNTIGGAGSAGNQISGNTKGVLINSVENNLVHGNLIGTNASGDEPLGNVRGVVVSNGVNNQIGDERNVISGNIRSGVRIFGASATGNVVADNFIGTNAAGDAAVPNRNGVLISSNASGNTIGNGIESGRNLISGNSDAGVLLLSDNNTVIGNFIGTDDSGTSAVPNETGVLIRRSSDQTIGGVLAGSTRSGSSNVVSGNTEAGIHVTGSAASNNHIAGNLIGTDLTGTVALGNKHGVVIESPTNFIGGSTTGKSNVISGNVQNGVYLKGPAATDNRVSGNRIGIGADAMSAVANERSGVLIENAPGNLIGGSFQIGGLLEPGGNSIGGNGQQGIKISGAGAANNRILGNRIGFDLFSQAIVANRDGIRIADGATGTVIGDAEASLMNRIAHNTGRGVWISDGTGNTVTRNAIYDNGAIGISLGARGATPNDPDDADTGANNLQNFPVIDFATLDGGNLEIQFAVSSTTANSAYPITVEFFIADAAGQEGERFRGSHVLAAPATLTATFNGDFIGMDERIVATATDADGNTSEFSDPVPLGVPLRATRGETARSPVSSLTAAALEPVVDAGVARLLAAGFAPALDNADFVIADLPGAVLGLATSSTITIDVNAAGHGWYVDSTPLDDSEFDTGSRLSTLDSQPGIDLLTVVMHELGHLAGLDHLYDDQDDLMFWSLESGVRKTSVEASVADRAFVDL